MTASQPSGPIFFSTAGKPSLLDYIALSKMFLEHRQLLPGPVFLGLFCLIAGAAWLKAEDAPFSEHSFCVSALVAVDHSVNRCIPMEALGAAVDGHQYGGVVRMFSNKNVAEVRSARLLP